MVKILHLQYGTTAASPANRLHRAFVENGLSSQILSLYADNIQSSDIHILDKKSILKSKVNNFIESHLVKGKVRELGNARYVDYYRWVPS